MWHSLKDLKLGICRNVIQLRDALHNIIFCEFNTSHVGFDHARVRPWLTKTLSVGHVHRKLADVAVELAREAEAARHAAEAGRHEVVQVAVGRRRELEGPEADIVQRPGESGSSKIKKESCA